MRNRWLRTACAMLVVAGILAAAEIVPLGDVDGDGFDDFAVGSVTLSPGGFVQSSATGSRGAVWAISGRHGDVLWCIPGNQELGYLGRTLASGSDIDGDGVQDVVVGLGGFIPFRPRKDGPLCTKGRVLVLSGTSGDVLLELVDPSSDSSFGFSVAGLGDLNGDGFGDLVVSHGHPREHTSPWNGLTYLNVFDAGMLVYSGLDGSILLDASWRGGADSAYSFPIARCGDLNGDGISEILASGRTNDGTMRAVFALSGADGNVLQAALGASEEVEFGDAIAEVGDVDGDGIQDWAVGHPCDIPNRGLGPNQSVRVYSGQDGGMLYSVRHPQAGSPYLDGNIRGFGYALAKVGDVDEDGHSDFLVSAPHTWEPWGVVQLLSGRDGRVIYEFGPEGNEEAYGRTIAGVGDVTGDGIPDMAVGTGVLHNPAAAAGVRVYSGVDGTVVYELHRNRTGSDIEIR